MGARVTMRDVAKVVGVSPMTVSRALKDDKTVHQDTRDRVRKVASDLGYVYDTNAQAFRTQKSGFVAVTLPSLNNANFAQTYRALTEGLAGTGRQVLLGATNYTVQGEEDLVRQLLARNPEALILTGGHHTDATRALIEARGLPVIEIWDKPAQPLGHVVGFSNAQAMTIMVSHLVQSGRRKLAFVGASQGDARGADRRDGVIAAARSMGLPAVDVLDAGPAPVSMRHGAALVARWGAQLLAYDAVLCVSDPVAFGVVSECRRQGINVPQDLAVTGFGHFEVAAIAEPRITTLDVGAADLGTAAAQVLRGVFDGTTLPDVIETTARLIRGGTS